MEPLRFMDCEMERTKRATQINQHSSVSGYSDTASSSSSSNNNNNANMDEFSLNSATNEKILRASKDSSKLTTERTSDKFSTNEQSSNKRQDPNNKRAQQHFRIDWRQLCYYQKPDSYISSFLGKFIGNKNHQSPVMELDDHEPDCSGFDTMKSGSNGGESLVDSSTRKQPKRILNSLDGCFKSGQLSAILGPSGAGKSTFLSTLFGTKHEGAYGQTKVTWFDEYGQMITSKKRRAIKIASLPQHDHLLHHLTVYETLMFASKIKNSTAIRSGESSQQYKKRKNFHKQNVRRVAKMLKLSECLDTRCGKLSGGQYKRVSIGQELLSEPDVIILDEPTSGLDAMTCLTTVQTLKSIVTKHPMSIILTIHQPDMDVFALFDHVYVIAQGGLAIYEGPPQEIIPTLAAANLKIPSSTYNPARLIVEHAFVVEPGFNGHGPSQDMYSSSRNLSTDNEDDDDDEDSEDYLEDEDTLNNDSGVNKLSQMKMSNYIKRSVLSLTGAISGKELSGSALILNSNGDSGATNGRAKKDKKPLLNIGIQTLDGKLITSEKLQLNRDNELRQQQNERWNLLKRLNAIQKGRYLNQQDLHSHDLDLSSTFTDGLVSCSLNESEQLAPNHNRQQQQHHISFHLGHEAKKATANITNNRHDNDEKSSEKSDYSSSGWSSDQRNRSGRANETADVGEIRLNMRSASLMQIPAEVITGNELSDDDDELLNKERKLSTGRSLQLVNENVAMTTATASNSNSDHESVLTDHDEFVVNFSDHHDQLKTTTKQDECRHTIASPTSFFTNTTTTSTLLSNNNKRNNPNGRMRRQFDKRLSAKHNCSKQTNYPIWYHAFLLTHRTWLSIVRDPIFFGIQAMMHTTIPILLGVIFGSVQEEGCPRIGNFDLVEFAYSDSQNLIQGTVASIRQSIGNIGIMFFEMFVLSFSINCITALVFPADMHVLLKEYRNGWYSLRSYFFGRTLADLPVPIFLHSLAMAILYYITGQPHSHARFWSIIGIVILASLVAQSVGLTVGALLMKSSQSAVLAAAGIVAPFFALSGFIVRIHTLPFVAQLAAKCSYLYHLINGFIILRYGFGRCPCSSEDFEPNSTHQIPSNLHTLASMWIGTYSNEYTESPIMSGAAGSTSTANPISSLSNRTNVDPNIDIVDKMMNTFKMANSYGHQIQTCEDVLPYAMLDFNLRDHDIYKCFMILVLMVIISRFITFSAIYYKIRSFA